jgi:hypothetical protein
MVDPVALVIKALPEVWDFLLVLPLLLLTITLLLVVAGAAAAAMVFMPSYPKV